MPQVDEAWHVEPSVVDEGLEPAMMDRLMPQMLLTSTAHRRATALMRRRFESALRGMGEDFETLLLWWGAPFDADISDPDVWRAASPYWTSERARMIRGKFERAQRGELDPDAEDPDPVEGFKAQYLNIWPEAAKPRLAPGLPVIEAEGWAGLLAPAPDRLPDAVAIESYFGDGVSVAAAWSTGEEVVVSVATFPTLRTAAEYATSIGVVSVLAGKTLAGDPDLEVAGLVAESVGSTARESVVSIRHLLDEEVLRHDGGELLTGQLLAARIELGPEGPRLRSTGRHDAIKASAWAAERARNPVGAAQIW
jgi:hypothetical protein